MTAAWVAAWFSVAVPRQAEKASPAPRGVWFADATAESGLAAFRQVKNDDVNPHISGANGGGVALVDYDGDGRLDVFLVSASRLGPWPGGDPPTNRLYRNVGGDPRTGVRFEDVTRAAGLDSKGAFGQGCAVADVNGDGRPDFFVANVGKDSLWLSQPDGTYVDGAEKAGVADPRWSSGAAFLDYDRDGDLDLYVANYIALEPGTVEQGPRKLIFSDWKGQRVFKGPHGLPPEKDALYRNEGDGTFTDVTAASGIGSARPAYGFEPVAWDYDDDGDADLFVSNDSMANFLWRNEGNGTFTDVAVVAGVAFNDDGRPVSNMGVAVGDEDGDGRLDLLITTFSDEINTLYRNRGHELFEVATLEAGLGGLDVVRNLSWGTSFLDVDDDGDLDLFVASGHTYPQADLVGGGYSYGQRNLLFLHGADGRYTNVSAAAGPGMQVARSSRGSAAGDLDDDGDLDLVVNNLGDVPTLLLNQTEPRGHALLVELVGRGLNRSAIGARVTVSAGGRTQLRELRSSGSYISHEDLRAHFGLGAATAIDRVDVRWPDGSVETIAAPPCDHLLRIEQGRGLCGSRPLGS